jgi:sarcosine oxidase subunit beta
MDPTTVTSDQSSRRHYRVAIVGCGVIGASIGWHLARAGVKGVGIVDKEHGPGLGSSSRANGGFRSQWFSPANIRFSQYSVGELASLAERHPALAFRQVGYLFVTGTEVGETQLRRGLALQTSLGVEAEWVEPSFIQEIAPFVRMEGLRGGTFGKRDGTVDPYQVATAFADEARAAGVEVLTGAEVTEIRSRPGGFTLATTAGDLDCEWLVNAAGPFARRIAAMAGVDLPVEPLRRNLALTEPEGEELVASPMCIDLETKLLVRTEGPAFLLAYSDPAEPPSFDTSFDPRFLIQVAERAGNRFPFLEGLRIDERKCWAGLYPETPDHHAIIGPAQDLPRFVSCVGFGGHGIMHSPAAGQAVAELITLGRCETFDLRPFRPSRFAEGELTIEAGGL